MEKVKIFGVDIFNTTLEETTLLLKEFLRGDSLRVIYTPNTEIVMAAKNDDNLRQLVNRGDLIIPDGIGLIYGSRIKKRPLRERVTGFDTSMKLLDIANENVYSIYFLGGKEGIARSASERVKKDYPNVKIAGFHHGYFKGSHLGLYGEPEEEKIVEEINASNPDIIFVGFGFPKQELWIDYNRNRLNGKVIIGNGGVMDILAGEAKRAPDLFIKLGLEWFYRLIQNPSRIKRQMALPQFLIQVVLNKNSVE